MVGYLPSLDIAGPAVSSSSTDLENLPPPPPPRAAPAEQRQTSGCMTILVILTALMFVGGYVTIFILPSIVYYIESPQYSVTINSVSGLDPDTDLRLPVLDPAFNLTLSAASASHRFKKCVQPRTYVEVAYGCITLATTPTAQRLCVGPREAADQQLVATGTGVLVPGTVLDSLAADIRLGRQVYQITVHTGWWW